MEATVQVRVQSWGQGDFLCRLILGMAGAMICPTGLTLNSA